MSCDIFRQWGWHESAISQVFQLCDHCAFSLNCRSSIYCLRYRFILIALNFWCVPPWYVWTTSTRGMVLHMRWWTSHSADYDVRSWFQIRWWPTITLTKAMLVWQQRFVWHPLSLSLRRVPRWHPCISIGSTRYAAHVGAAAQRLHERAKPLTVTGPGRVLIWQRLYACEVRFISGRLTCAALRVTAQAHYLHGFLRASDAHEHASNTHLIGRVWRGDVIVS